MIVRIWHGYTTIANADIYEKLLIKEIIPELKPKKLKATKDLKYYVGT